jgi:hypothetical protein
MRGHPGKINVKSELKSVIGHNGGSADMVTIRQPKMQFHFRPCDDGNEALNESPVGIDVKQATIALISVYFAPGAKDAS